MLGPTVEAPLGVRVQQGDRRVPGARLLEGAQAAGHHRAAVQHRRAAADRPVRHGDPELRAPGARRPADHGLRRRHPVAQLHLRRRRRAGYGSLDRRAARHRPGVQHRQRRRASGLIGTAPTGCSWRRSRNSVERRYDTRRWERSRLRSCLRTSRILPIRSSWSSPMPKSSTSTSWTDTSSRRSRSDLSSWLRCGRQPTAPSTAI